MALQNFLYTETTISDVLDRYIEELKSTKKVEDLLHANKLISYQNLLKDKQFERDTRKLFNEIYDLIKKNHSALQFELTGRKKSLISTEKKIKKYFLLDKSLDLIRDFYAYRIILAGDESKIDLVEHCYKVVEEIIDFAAEEGFTPSERLPLIDADLSQHKNHFFSNFKYKHYIKDYICFPKKNGYRSLHLVLINTKGQYIEIQVRTLAMHAEIGSGDACHKNYEVNDKPIKIPLQREKISIAGYKHMNGKIFDMSGVEEAIPVIQRTKSF